MDIDFKPDPQLFPFESRWFESRVGRIHYIDEGTGTPIVFFHGQPTWSFLYRKIVGRLRDRFRCVAVDYPGFGLSVRPDGYGYTPAEHAGVIGDLVDHLGLDGFVTMGQDWGGPISTSIATERADRVRGLVLGNTWFWPADSLGMKIFSRVMSSKRMQSKIVEKNLFVEKMLKPAMSYALTDAEWDQYRKAQPSPEARRGVAEFPRQIIRSGALLEKLSKAVPEKLGSKPVLMPWGMKDFAFKPKGFIPRMRSHFQDVEVLELPGAKHYIQEDAPEEISEAIARRFG